MGWWSASKITLAVGIFQAALTAIALAYGSFIDFILIADYISFLATIYFVFLRPRFDEESLARKGGKPWSGTYLRLEFYDLGIRTGYLPAVNINDLLSNAGSKVQEAITGIVSPELLKKTKAKDEVKI